MRRILLIASLSIAVSSHFLCTTRVCSGGETVFSGGSLDDLRELSPTLSFDRLRITGSLGLAPGSSGSATLTVTDLTIDAGGSIGYSYSTCTYLRAPDLTVQATGRVVVHGDIRLNGRSGTRVTSSATCNSCYGRDGGDIRITADEIIITSSLSNKGGEGSTSVSSDCSSGCSGGDAGAIHLEAKNITLNGATLSTGKGSGGTGYCYGNQNHGASGKSGPIDLIADDLFKMSQSSVSTDGTLTLEASQADIYGPMNYGQLIETIGGQTDEIGPEVLEILSPLPDSTIPINEPLEIRIRLKDSLTGIKEVQVTGLGHDELHSGTEIEDGILSILLPKPTTPPILQVTAWDNEGNSSEASATGLSLEGGLTIAEGETYVLSGDLALGGASSSINILGTMVIARGSNPKISAGSFIVADTGHIKIEDPGEHLQTKAPSLSISLTGSAEINGTIDVSGHRGLNWHEGSWEQDGEPGGDFALTAMSINITGSVLANGGMGLFYEWGTFKYEGGTGGNGGNISLYAHESVGVNGTLSVKGGDANSFGESQCKDPGDGGDVLVFYLTTADLSGASIHVEGGGEQYQDFCNAFREPSGHVLVNYRGMPDPSHIVTINEVELNNSKSNAQAIFPFVQVKGFISPGDGELYFTNNPNDHFEDLYLLKLQHPLSINVMFTQTSVEADLDLWIFDYNRLTTVGMVLFPNTISSLSLQAKDYIIAVNQYGTTPPAGTAYTLTLAPAIEVDGDGDGMSDWWEVLHFNDITRDGTLDWDGDGLSDKQEHDNGTYPKTSDTDGDGMPDGWELSNGLNASLNADGSQDADGDGVKNCQEYVDGTDPQDDRSYLVDPGDINDDGSVDLGDAILICQAIRGIPPAHTMSRLADVNGDEKIGLAEVLYVFQSVSGLR